MFGPFFLTHEARAQTVSGYTTIDYYADTNTVDAYSETDEDYDVNSAYSAFVSLTIRDQNSNYLGGAVATDDGSYGFAAVEVQFSGSPDTTYTATALHKAYANEWEYDYTYWPFVSISYYDSYNFGFFEDQGIVSPLHYSFLGPGPMATRPSRPIILGFTTDEASVTTQTNIPVRFTYVAQAYGTADFPKSNDGQTWSVTLDLPSNSPPCNGATFNMNVHLHKDSGGTLYGGSDPRNQPDTPSDSQYQVMGGGLQGGDSNSPHFNMVLKRLTPSNPNRHIRFPLAGYTSSGGFSVTGFVTIHCN